MNLSNLDNFWIVLKVKFSALNWYQNLQNRFITKNSTCIFCWYMAILQLILFINNNNIVLVCVSYRVVTIYRVVIHMLSVSWLQYVVVIVSVSCLCLLLNLVEPPWHGWQRALLIEWCWKRFLPGWQCGTAVKVTFVQADDTLVIDGVCTFKL